MTEKSYRLTRVKGVANAAKDWRPVCIEEAITMLKRVQHGEPFLRIR